MHGSAGQTSSSGQQAAHLLALELLTTLLRPPLELLLAPPLRLFQLPLLLLKRGVLSGMQQRQRPALLLLSREESRRRALADLALALQATPGGRLTKRFE